MVKLLVTYMEQRSRPAETATPPPRPDARVVHEKLHMADYLFLYREIGEPVQWDDRLRMTPEALSNFLQDVSSNLFILYVGDIRVGLYEAYVDHNSEIEITNFGLVPGAQGQKLGPFLLDYSLRALWDQRPRQIWLHTDTNDHPNAVKTYKRAGFQAYCHQWQEFPD